MALQSRGLVRSQPYGTQVTSVGAVVANAGTIIANFDISVVIADRNNSPTGVIQALASVGPYLDVMVFSTGIGTLDVLVACDTGAGFATLLPAPLAVAVGVVLTVNQLRIPARYVRVTYTNTSGGNATTDFGAYVRSN